MRDADGEVWTGQFGAAGVVQFVREEGEGRGLDGLGEDDEFESGEFEKGAVRREGGAEALVEAEDAEDGDHDGERGEDGDPNVCVMD